jgi:ketopantoate reductase
MQFGGHFNPKIDRKLEDERLNHFVDLLRQGGTDVELVPSIDLWRWKKTIWYVVFARCRPPGVLR